MEEKQLFAVVRVPKSGSSSLQKMVRDAYPGAAFHALPHSFFGDWKTDVLQKLRYLRSQKRSLLSNHGTLSLKKAIAAINRKSKSGDIVGGGHISFDTFRALEAKVNAITILRDPVARFISEYNYSRNSANRRPAPLRFDLAFSKKMALQHDINAYASIMLEHKPMVGNIACELLSITSSDQIAPRLDDLFHVGVLEDIDGFVAGLSEKAGTRLEMTRSNVTPNRTAVAIDADTRAKIEALYDLDMELHAQARDICDRHHRRGAEPSRAKA